MSFDSLLDHFYTLTGIAFNENRPIIHRKVERFYLQKGYTDYHDFFKALKDDKHLQQELINLLTTSETYFYREFSQIELFIEQIKEISRPIKILCAPCASGEEPYSILIAMLEAGLDINTIEIYGIDINSNEIEKAKKGCFAHRRLHKLSDELQAKYFTRTDNGYYEIIPALKRRIHFEQMNLFHPFKNGFSDFDVIFSRNMLIYFDRVAQERAEKIFYENLKPGGCLFVGHADPIYDTCGFEKTTKKGISFYTRPL